MRIFLTSGVKDVGAIGTDTNPLYIGRDLLAGRYGKATVDEVAVYGYALSAQQVADHYNASRW